MHGSFGCSTLSGHWKKNHHTGILAEQYPVLLITCRRRRRHSSSRRTWWSRRPARVHVTILDLSSLFALNNNDASLVIQMSTSLPFPSRPHRRCRLSGRQVPFFHAERERALWRGYKGFTDALYFQPPPPLFLLSPPLLFNYFSHTFTKGRRLSETPEV